MGRDLIRLKRIYNFWVIHASFVILSHVFTINYIIFMHFVGLTYWQDVQCQFPVFAVFLFQKFTSGNILGSRWKFTGNFYLPTMKYQSEGEPEGRPTGQRRPPAAAQGPPAGGAHPCPWDLTSTPSDAYKLPLNLKTSRRPLFSRNSTPTHRHRKP